MEHKQIIYYDFSTDQIWIRGTHSGNSNLCWTVVAMGQAKDVNGDPGKYWEHTTSVQWNKKLMADWVELGEL